MKNKFYNLLVLLVLTSLAGCNEKLTIDTIEQKNPEISGFTPSSGKAGTEVTVNGEFMRDVLKASIGGVEAQIRYKISQQELVLVVPHGAQSGKIALSTKDNKTESAESFTVIFPTPVLTKIPAGGKVGDEVEIQGENLDVASKVFFDGEEAEITYQSETEIVVKVPFIIEESATFSLRYHNAAGEQTIAGDNKGFGITKDHPVISNSIPVKVTEGDLISLAGSNLHLIEKILFGNTEAVISRQTPEVIEFRVPTLPETTTVAIEAVYYKGTVTKTLAPACEVVIPKVFFYPNLMIGAHRNAEFGNMINATTGQVSTTCILKPEMNAQALIDFAAVHNSANDFALNGPHNVKANLKNYWCNGKALPSTASLDEINAVYGGFTSTTTTFVVLLEGVNAPQDELINQVKSGNITEISIDATPSLFNGTIVPDKSSVRSRKKEEAAGFTDVTVYKPGSVIIFKNEKKKKVGILLIRTVDVDYDKDKAYNDGNATITFDLYYER